MPQGENNPPFSSWHSHCWLKWEIRVETIRQILSVPRSEVFVNFMLRDIARFLSKGELEITFDDLFGTNEWKAIVESKLTEQDKEFQLRDLYIKQLGSLHCLCTPFRVCMDNKIQTLYYMIHATKHPRGRMLMKSVMKNQGAGGAFAYLGPEDKAVAAQMKLINDDIANLQQLLLRKFAGQTKSFMSVQEESCMDTDLVESDYRKAIQDLRKDEKVTVKPVTSKTERGLSGGDLIAFPNT
ncbi:MAG: three-Cys-motif partner protein TcmP [Chloroflexi bacterium]|nr:three-Cys-motif partner protein TcmP [Chloroflexota bacterium]